MLEITNFRDGEILNFHCGRESDDSLEITIEGIAPPQEHVTVNGVPARRHDRIFLADVKLTQKINRIVVSSDGYFGEKTLAITLVWDKRSYKRYCFFVDDCSFFLRKLTLDRPKSLFDEMFLGGLKKPMINTERNSCSISFTTTIITIFPSAMFQRITKRSFRQIKIGCDCHSTQKVNSLTAPISTQVPKNWRRILMKYTMKSAVLQAESVLWRQWSYTGA